jgi:hypothetical protein
MYIVVNLYSLCIALVMVCVCVCVCVRARASITFFIIMLLLPSYSPATTPLVIGILKSCISR